MAKKLTVQTTGELIASGSTGQGDNIDNCHGVSTANCWDYSGPGGGGSGGAVLLVGGELAIGSIRVQVAGGLGGLGGESHGGRGGVGRIALRYTTSLTGSTNPAADETKLP